MRIGIVAGEASGDLLGADIIRAITKRFPGAIFEGIAGPQMEREGCRTIFPMERLSVMGLTEVAGRYFELLGIRNRLAQHFISQPPDVFIGIDAPDFNLGLEKRLHAHKIKTVHYVSPQVWAWREYRLRKIRQSTDLMLALFPFEKDYYTKHGIPVTCVGHPLARKIPLQPDKDAARRRLGLPMDKRVIAIMPGSRKMEIDRLLDHFLSAAAYCFRQDSGLRFICSVLNDNTRVLIRHKLEESGLAHLPFTLFSERSHDVLEAADVALLASGTITLEAMLFKRPMVVAYRVNQLTYYLLKSLIKVKYVSLPNILAGRALVPECLQADCTPQRLGEELMRWLDNPGAVTGLEQEFTDLHRQLKLESAELAADSIIELVASE